MEKAMSDPVVIHEEEDLLSSFRKYVVAELRNMNQSQLCCTKIRIQQAIMEGQMQSVIEQWW